MKNRIYVFSLLLMLMISANGCDYDKDFDVLAKNALSDENGDGGGGGGGGGGDCPVGTWYSSTCGNSKGVVWKFGSDKRGSFSNMDCNGICSPIVFTFTYSISGNTISLVYDAQQPIVKCSGYEDSRPPKPANASITFSCSGSGLTVTSGNGTITFTR